MKDRIKGILEKLGKPIITTENMAKVQIEDSLLDMVEEEDQQQESDNEDETRDDESDTSSLPNDEFKTPRGKPIMKKSRFNLQIDDEDDLKTPTARPTTSSKIPMDGAEAKFPSHVLRYPELKNHADAAVSRCQNKIRQFSNKLDIIENRITDGLLGMARVLMKNIEKQRVELEENIEGITFMLGDGASTYEKEGDYY